jgi:hypothetical protein
MQRRSSPPQPTIVFELAKTVLAAATPLVHLSLGAVLLLAVNASDIHMGMALEQLQGGQWRPLSFFHTLSTPIQQLYFTFDRELLAVISAEDAVFGST